MIVDHRAWRRGFAAVLFLLPAASLAAAELVTLSPENYDEYVPQGQEVDAVWGDYVLRNDKITAVVSDPLLHNGRSGSRRGAYFAGRLIDLTTRDGGNDLLGNYDAVFYWPDHRSTPGPAGIKNDANKQGDFPLPKDAHKQPGREPQSAETVTLRIPHQRGVREVRYILADGWSHLRIEVEYVNDGAKPLTATPHGLLTFGPQAIDGHPHWQHGISADGRTLWCYDPLFGQAYAVLGDGDETLRRVPAAVRPHWLLYTANVGEAKSLTIEPGKSHVVVRKIIPGKNLFDVLAAARELRGESLQYQDFQIADGTGVLADALIRATVGKDVIGIGVSDADGVLRARVPIGKLHYQIAPRDRDPIASDHDANSGPFITTLHHGAWVDVQIQDDAGRGLPAKVIFRGIDKTPDPQFFSTLGDERVGNVLQPADGKVWARIPLGKYRVTVVRGIEYDAVEHEIETKPGVRTPIHVTLKRSVDTTGAVSAEFTNRSTASRNWTTATTRGRVLNLLAEGIEFAPATEVTQVFSYQPIVDELKAGAWLKTVDGVNIDKPVRKSFNSQNAFPLKYVRGDYDGGIPQRPAHVFQIYWLSQIPLKLDASGNIMTTGGEKRLYTMTPPGIWPNDGRHEGMSWLFDERRVRLEDFMRNARLRELSHFHSLEIEPLDVFLDLPEYDPRDPLAEKDLAAWHADLDSRAAKHWPEVTNRQRDWIRFQNLGYRMTGVVNNAAKDNLHGSGFWRNYLAVGHDDPAKLTTDEVIDTVRTGKVVMTNGPYLEVAVKNGTQTAGPGEPLTALDRKAELQVRVQCPNWLDVDRVQVLFNGARVTTLEATRSNGAAGFRSEPGPIRFEATLPLEFVADTKVMVLASGTGRNLRPTTTRNGDTYTTIALSNPVYIDVDGDGCRPHSPVEDKTFSRIDVAEVPQAGKPLTVKATLKNMSDAATRDVLPFVVEPDDAATLSDSRPSYELAAGEEKAITFTITPTGKHASFVLRAPRSTGGVGRRAAGVSLTLGKLPRQQTPGWLYEHAPDLRAAQGLPPLQGIGEPKND